jgi:hypothetical protein
MLRDVGFRGKWETESVSLAAAAISVVIGALYPSCIFSM